MTSSPPLTAEFIAEALRDLPDWDYCDDALHCSLRFSTFVDAIAFMVRGSFAAEALNHHPEWTNVYDRVSIRLTTHEVENRVTARDLNLARRLNALRYP